MNSDLDHILYPVLAADLRVGAPADSKGTGSQMCQAYQPVPAGPQFISRQVIVLSADSQDSLLG